VSGKKYRRLKKSLFLFTTRRFFLYSYKINNYNFEKMETLEMIKELAEVLSVDTTKFFKGNKSAGTRARKTAQELKALLQKLRGEILEHKNTEDNA
jgi:hypothetical protein